MCSVFFELTKTGNHLLITNWTPTMHGWANFQPTSRICQRKFIRPK